MSTLSYAIRGSDGVVVRGQTADGAGNVVFLGQAKDVSLNLTPDEISGYVQQGNDLVIHLASGETLTLENYFQSVNGEERALFISKNGAFQQVDLGEPVVDQYFAQYQDLSTSEKWSTYDQLTFLDLERVEPVVAPLIAPLAGIAPGLLGLGGAAVAATALSNDGDGSGSGEGDESGAGDGGDGDGDGSGDGDGDGSGGGDGGGSGGGDGGGSGGGDPIIPTVDDPDVSRIVGGTAASSVTITGTGEAGSTVTVTIGTQTGTTTIADDGTYSVSFDAGALPADGVYSSTVNVVAPDATTYNLSGPSVDIDTTAPDVGVQDGTVATGDIVNEAEHTAGHEISGTGEAGAALTVEINGTTHSTTVQADGTWSVTFASGEINTGEYTTDVTITSTDARGNVTTVTDALQVDTVAPPVALNAVEGDNVINASEASDGVVLSGTGEPGSSLSITFGGITQTTTVGADGNWSSGFVANAVSSGTYDTTVSIIATDAAGNTTTSTTRVDVDTEISAGIDANQVGGDDVANATEVLSGFDLTGIAEAGSTVVVQLAGASRTVTAGADGTWSATFSAADVPPGQYDAAVQVTATDAAGNSASSSSTLRIDTSTEVNVDISAGVFAAPVNAAQMQGGVVLQGTTEANAQVVVDVDGVFRRTTADDDGNWSVSYEPGSLAEGTYTANVNLSVTDTAGNTANASAAFQVDTEITNPIVDSVTFTGTDVSSLVLDTESQTYDIHALNTDGTTTDVATTEYAKSGNRTEFELDTPAPDGTHLVVTSEDNAGNKSDTLIVLDDNATNAGTLDHAALGGFNVEAIELDYAAGAQLTLTEQQIKDLSETSDTLTIHGGDSDPSENDQITVNGAVKTNQTETIDGQTYDVYTVGNDGVTLVVDQDIKVII
ncbi:BapA prefix-like domain-containing protein [Shimia sp. R10_1]|uniref:Ig-like domain-containing protein n=1 Tax=Shimia sp. R10_1 TaxID=2821095 RepID=UPI001ADA0E9C|nr:Ig-like domain-containing protein [Shimia sp. R10_1]MBO9471991.1 BapA prefix-like domain-containing protein [Shimia sp. R10_1]